MRKDLKVGDTFEEELGNGYVAVFKVVGVNDDKTYTSERIALNRANTSAKKVDEVKAEEPKVEAPKKTVAKPKTAPKRK